MCATCHCGPSAYQGELCFSAWLHGWKFCQLAIGATPHGPGGGPGAHCCWGHSVGSAQAADMCAVAASFRSCEYQVSNLRQLRSLSAVYAYTQPSPPKSCTCSVPQARRRPRNFRASPSSMWKKCWHGTLQFSFFEMFWSDVVVFFSFLFCTCVFVTREPAVVIPPTV